MRPECTFTSQVHEGKQTYIYLIIVSMLSSYVTETGIYNQPSPKSCSGSKHISIFTVPTNKCHTAHCTAVLELPSQSNTSVVL